MADTDVLDMLLEFDSGILLPQVEMEQDQQLTQLPSTTTTPVSLLDNIEWNSLLYNSVLDQNDFFEGVMDTNLSDDIKEKQLQPKFNTDHAYSATPGSPNSDSGISNGPSSPAISSSGLGSEPIAFDLDQELFGPLNLKDYENLHEQEMDPVILGSWSDSSSCSPELKNDEATFSFDFDTFVEKSPSQPVSDLTISTDETTKIVKVLSVNDNQKKSHSLLSNFEKTSVKASSTYPQITLSDEEKNLLRKEGISLPTHLPLTREEEKILRSVRRRIRNKASARNSRRKKQDYMEALEERVKLCTEEKKQLERKVTVLEKQNSSLIGQLRKLQKVVAEGTKQTAKASSCVMILALSCALVLLPNFQSFMGSSSSDDILVKSAAAGRPSRSLLSKADDTIKTDDSYTSYLPYFNLNKMVSPAQMIHEPVDGLDAQYIHDSIDTHAPSDDNAKGDGDEVIHMEITKLPIMAEVLVKPGIQSSEMENNSHVNVAPLHLKQTIPRRSIKMDLDDEL